MTMPGTVMTPGQVVMIAGGNYRGRTGVVAGDVDGTNSIRVRLSIRSEYDALRPPEYAWVPVEFLTVWG